MDIHSDIMQLYLNYCFLPVGYWLTYNVYNDFYTF